MAKDFYNYAKVAKFSPNLVTLILTYARAHVVVIINVPSLIQ